MGIRKAIGISLLAVAFFISPVSPVIAQAATVSDISKQLICQCGCNSVLINCTHAECGSRSAMTAEIAQQVDSGQSGEQIIQSFVARYGEAVLASPPKRGFNLTAWILPFAAILAGGAVIYLLLKRWVMRGGQSQTAAAVKGGERDEEYYRRLDRELKEFTERGFR